MGRGEFDDLTVNTYPRANYLSTNFEMLPNDTKRHLSARSFGRGHLYPLGNTQQAWIALSFVLPVTKNPGAILRYLDQHSFSGRRVTGGYSGMRRQLFSEELAVKDLPATWNALLQVLSELTPTAHKQGVLEDVLWSGGASRRWQAEQSIFKN